MSGQNIIFDKGNIDISSLVYKYTLPYNSGLYYLKFTMAGCDLSSVILLNTFAEGIGAVSIIKIREDKFQQSANIFLEFTNRDVIISVSNMSSEAHFRCVKMC